MILSVCVTTLGVLIGWFALGFQPQQTLLPADGLFALWPVFSLTTPYSTQILGGIQIDAIYGRPWILATLQALHVGTISALNITCLILQIVFAFFMTEGLRAGLPRALTRREHIVVSLIGVGLFAFMPTLGWRFSRGHLNLLQGIYALGATLSLYFLAREKVLRAPHVVAFLFLMLNCLPAGGAQILAYGVAFALPFLLAFAHEDLAAAWRTVFYLMCGLMVAAPWMAAIAQSLMAGDFARATGSESLIYSYITQNADDWLGSITWFFPVFRPLRDFNWQHEAYYALGPLTAAAIPLLVREKNWRWLAAAGTSMSMVICFASHVDPVAHGLIELMPFLKSFRVPARSLQIPILFLGFVVARELIRQALKAPVVVFTDASNWLIGGLAALLLAMVPATLKEALAWLITGALVAMPRRLPRAAQWAGLGALAWLSFLAFVSTLLLPLPNLKIKTDELALQNKYLQEHHPQLLKPLVRTLMPITEIGPSLGVLAGTSSTEGYWFANAHFVNLLAALENHPPLPTQMTFYIDPSNPAFDVFKDLYNVQAVRNNQRLPADFLNILPDTGSVWASGEQRTYDSYALLAEVLHQPAMRHDVQWIEAPAVPAPPHPECRGLQGTGLTSRRDNGEEVLEFDVQTPAACPVTVSTNYTSTMRVQDGEQAVATYMADGALLGFMLPPGSHHLRIETSTPAPWPMWLVLVAGVTAAMALFRWDHRRS